MRWLVVATNGLREVDWQPTITTEGPFETEPERRAAAQMAHRIAPTTDVFALDTGETSKRPVMTKIPWSNA